MVHSLDVFPKVPFVKFLVPDHLMQELQLPQGELLGKHLKGHVLAVQLFSERGEGHVGDLIVVKCQGGEMVDIHPFGLSGERCGFGGMVMERHEAKVGHCDHPSVREFTEGLQPALVLGILNASWVTKGMELL